MKITVLYGEDIVASRARFGKIIDGVKKRGWDVVHINQKESLRDQLSSQMLIDSGSLYVIEDGGKIEERDWEWMKDANLDLNLLIWQKGALVPCLKKNLPKETRYEVFEMPKLIFKLCETVWPGNVNVAIKLFHKVIETENVEFILAMLARHLRELWIVKNDPKNTNYLDWKRSKLKALSGKYEEWELKKVINELAKADIDAKTGGIDLVTSLDLILLTHLK